MSTRKVIIWLGGIGFGMCLGVLLFKTQELVGRQEEAAASQRPVSLSREAEQLERVLKPLAVEVSAGPAQIEVSFSGDTLFFAYNDSSLLPDAQRKLRFLAETIADRYEKYHLLVVGHTDDRGDPDYNKRLGKQRAEMVADFLAANGLDLDAIKSMSMGEGAPIATNDTESGRTLNRRVEIRVKPIEIGGDPLDPWVDAFLKVLKNHPVFVVCGALSSLITVLTWLSGLFAGAGRRRLA